MPTSVLRRYTPPTCTLEIAATGSALSRWTDRTMLKNLRFQLSFDDPKLSSEQQITIRGDRTQLEALKTAVETYVQKILSQSPEEILGTTGSGAVHSLGNGSTNPITNDAPHQTNPPVTNPPVTNPPVNSAAITAAAIEASLAKMRAQESMDSPENNGSLTSLSDAEIYLHPQSLTAHRLYLGSLGQDTAGTVVPLSTTQLFDLANALDEYGAEADSLPDMNRSSWIKSPGTWGKIAAGIAAVSVVGLPMIYFVRGISTPTTQVAAQSNREVQSIAVQPPSGRTPTLPPPPAPLANSPALQPLPASALPSPGSTTAPPLTTNGINGISGGMPSSISSGVSSGQPSELPPVAIAPESSSIIVAPAAPDLPRQFEPIDPEPQRVTPAPKTEIGNAPPALMTSEAEATTIVDQSSREAFEQAAAIANNNNLRVATGTRVSSTAPASADAASPAMGSRSSGAGAPSAANGASVANASGVSTEAQLLEVRSYFENNWQPPEGLNSKLEYRLLLSPDGSLQRIVPIGDTSGNYLDRVPMPLMGEAFISPSQNGQSPQIRLVLEPNGQVRTLLEYAN